MALDKIIIGTRVRKIREEIFEETREEFATRCGLTERHIGQIERGDFLPGLKTLDKIIVATGIGMDFILYGKGSTNKLQVKENLYNIIDTSDKEDLNIYYKFICNIRGYIEKKTRK